MRNSDDRLVAARAAAQEVKDGMLIGLGSGRTVALMVSEVAKRGLEVTCVCSSAQIMNVALKHGLRILPIESADSVDLVLDGADEVDKALRMLKGGGGALARERIIHSLGPVVIAIESSKFSDKIGKRAPVVVEVLPPARRLVAKLLRRLNFNVTLRVDDKGFPVFTENGNVLLDAKPNPDWNPEEVCREIRILPGVVEVGIFLSEAEKVYVGEGGKVRVLARKL